jgi:carboxylesterase type B
MYDATPLLTSAISLGKPFVFVAVNYRVGGFGFMPGKEILKDGSANLGLLDQRMGLEWTADNIASFGGDPSKVTIWGESAGAISVLDQMVLFNGNNIYNGKPLFRGAIMNSGSVAPASPVNCTKGQAVYDTVVKSAGCSSAKDTLACLRSVDYTTFLNAANSVPGLLSYNSVALSYLPRPDGKVLTDSPDILVQQGKYAAVPMIIGDQEDEGTLFSVLLYNTTTTSEVVDWLHTKMLDTATRAEVAALVATYDTSITAGSPFRTSILNELYPGFKRTAAILGDIVFTLARRGFLASSMAVNPSVPSWSYLASYDYGTPFLGSVHGGDLLQVFYGILPNYASRSIQSYYANFVYNLNPNNASGGTSVSSSAVTMNWPQWKDSKQLMQFFSNSASLLTDDFRSDSYDYIASNAKALKI